MRNVIFIAFVSVASALFIAPTFFSAGSAHSADINEEVARSYNEGVSRCSNPECAKYLYACFRTYASEALNNFLVCGVQASRLNDDKWVVANPEG